VKNKHTDRQAHEGKDITSLADVCLLGSVNVLFK